MNDEKNLITIRELAKTLNCSKEAVRQKAKQVLPKKNFTERKTTFFNEEEVSLMLKSWKKNTSNNSSNKFNLSVAKTTTKELDRHNAILGIHNITKLEIDDKIKACLYLNNNLIKELKKENQSLRNNNKRLEAKQEAIAMQSQKKVLLKQRWSVVNRCIKQVAIDRAEKLQGFTTKNDYVNTYRYFYNEFYKAHRSVDRDKINKQYFFDYPKYMKELLEIIIADEVECKLTKEEEKLFD